MGTITMRSQGKHKLYFEHGLSLFMIKLCLAVKGNHLATMILFDGRVHFLLAKP